MEQLQQYGITLWDDAKIKAFRQTLLQWYDANKRDLPWRRTKDPYAIWVSEIMLQQTQVSTVIPYYRNFLRQFPNVVVLANAPEEKLLKAWEGLGYYSRVKNMQKAAQQIVNDYNGVMPSQYKTLLTLKGIGSYTAGAIASIAFNECVPAVDGNVMRIMARLFEINLDIGDAKNKKVFEWLTQQLVDPNRPGDFNQALMDLGSDICSAKNAKPHLSPIKDFNQAYLNGTMDIYPIKKKKIKPQDVYYYAFVTTNSNGEHLLIQRTNSGLLSNMWLSPMIEVAPFTTSKQHNKTSESLMQSHVFEEELLYETDQFLGDLTHVFSHLKWHIRVFHRQQMATPTVSGKWVHPSQFEHYPLPTPQLKLLQLYAQHAHHNR